MAESGGSGGSQKLIRNCANSLCFTTKDTRVTLRCNAFFTFSYPSRLKHLVLRVFFRRLPARKALKSRCFSWEGYQKVKKHRAIAPAALEGCGGLGQIWEALAELWEALGELWEALYIEKLPINRTAAVMLCTSFHTPADSLGGRVPQRSHSMCFITFGALSRFTMDVRGLQDLWVSSAAERVPLSEILHQRIL